MRSSMTSRSIFPETVPMPFRMSPPARMPAAGPSGHTDLTNTPSGFPAGDTTIPSQGR